jgi:transposase
MRGVDHQQSHMFSYLSHQARVRQDHPLRTLRGMVDDVLRALSPQFDSMYASEGRPSIAPEKLLRARLLQMLYSIRSERLLMEEIDYSILFRWFVGLNPDEEVWDATVFTKNRDRLLEAEVAKQFLAHVVEQARSQHLTSDEHFTVDGTLLEAWAGVKTSANRVEYSHGRGKCCFLAYVSKMFRQFGGTAEGHLRSRDGCTDSCRLAASPTVLVRNLHGSNVSPKSGRGLWHCGPV